HEDAAEKLFDWEESSGGDLCSVAAHGSAGECTLLLLPSQFLVYPNSYAVAVFPLDEVKELVTVNNSPGLTFTFDQQVCARPMASQAQSGSEQRADVNVQQPVPALRRSARMTPLWRIMSSKPSGAFCQNNFECSTGFCRAGHCATNQRSEAVKY
uniref:Liver-expressed antimicrobial peptide 2 n=1 Tax=Oryzias latipes TaxID=8090 RepID=A0A3P9JPK7_ORYLA